MQMLQHTNMYMSVGLHVLCMYALCVCVCYSIYCSIPLVLIMKVQIDSWS